MLVSLETLSPTSCYAPRNQRFPGRRPKADVTFALPPVASACKHASCRRSRRRVRSGFGSDVPTTAAPPRFDRKIMAPSPDALQIAWLSAKNGHLCAREQAKAWGLREAWRAEGKKDQAGLRLHVAGFLQKSLGGKPRGGSPSAQAVGQLFQRMDDDPEWFPGKTNAQDRKSVV